MKVGFLNYYEYCNNNKMFEDPSLQGLSDDLLVPFIQLYETATSKGIDISTIDTQPLESYDQIIFFDFPTLNNPYFNKLIESNFDNMILFIYECEIVMPDNWDKENFKYFKKIYTWNDAIIDNQKIFKYYFPIKIPNHIDFDTNRKDKLCALVASNKCNYHPYELYSKRLEAIRWFENNHPEDFDLFGYGWNDKPGETLANIWGTPEQKIRSDARPDEKPFTSYRGSVKSKNETLKKYKFSICYENAENIPGYVTEKIFDSFFAGCIPIYWGAPNINDYVPPETFIDKRDFNSYTELYNYIKYMPDETYQNYLRAIEEYVTEDKIYPFSAENFTDTIIKEIQSGTQHKNIITRSFQKLFKR
jgi:hypothetical protein